jgi:hypothetical protein
MALAQSNINAFKELMTVNDTALVSPVFLEWLITNKFFVKPAAIKYHGNHSGGLFEHSKAVTQCLVDLTESGHIKWQNPRSPYIVGMFHDLCKVEDYKIDSDTNKLDNSDPLGYTWTYNKDKILSGHGDKSVILLSQFLTLTEEEIMCIRFHMGAYETDGWNEYDAAIKKYETVLWTHTADMYASKVKGI